MYPITNNNFTSRSEPRQSVVCNFSFRQIELMNGHWSSCCKRFIFLDPHCSMFVRCIHICIRKCLQQIVAAVIYNHSRVAWVHTRNNCHCHQSTRQWETWSVLVHQIWNLFGRFQSIRGRQLNCSKQLTLELTYHTADKLDTSVKHHAN